MVLALAVGTFEITFWMMFYLAVDCSAPLLEATEFDTMNLLVIITSLLAYCRAEDIHLLTLFLISRLPSLLVCVLILTLQFLLSGIESIVHLMFGIALFPAVKVCCAITLGRAAAFNCDWTTNNHSKRFLIDSASNVHITNCRDYMSNYHRVHGSIITPGGRVGALGDGNISLKLDAQTNSTMKNVLYIPSSQYSILSLSEMKTLKWRFNFDKNYVILPNGCRIKIIEDNGLHFIELHDYIDSEGASSTTFAAEAEGASNANGRASVSEQEPDVEELSAIDLLHLRLGHISQKYIQVLLKMKINLGLSIPQDAKLRKLCVPCEICKSTRPHFGPRARHGKSVAKNIGKFDDITRVGQLVCSDMWGKFDTPSHNGSVFAIHFTDVYSRFSCVYFMRQKSEALFYFTKFVEEEMKPRGFKIEKFHTDNDSVYLSSQFKRYTADNGILQEQGAPYVHEHNGIAERYWRTLQVMAHCFLETAQLDLQFWALAFSHACYIRNRIPHSGIGFEIPLTRFCGEIPNLSRVRIFGSRSFAHIDQSLRQKMDPRAREGLYMGHSTQSQSYILWDPALSQIFHSGMVKIVELTQNYGRLINKGFQKSFNWPDDERKITDILEEYDVSKLTQIVDHDVWFQEDANITHAVLLVKFSTMEQPKWILLSHFLTQFGMYKRYSKYIKEQDIKRFSPLFSVVNIRHKIGKRYVLFPATVASTDYTSKDKLYYQAIYEDGSMQDVGNKDLQSPISERIVMAANGRTVAVHTEIPRTYKESQRLSDAHKWHEATMSELSSMYRMDVFDLCKWPSGKQVLKSRLVYARKRDGRYKARFVACGYSQKDGIDYDETFAPVTQLSTLRLFMALCLHMGLETFQMDVETAYLYSKIDKELYIHIPEGMDSMDEHGNKLCWKLKKGIYGLKQSGALWYAVISKWLTDYGFEQSPIDACLYIYKVEGTTCIMNTYVDDLFVGCNDSAFKAKLLADLRKDFNITESDAIDDAIGIQVTKTENGIKLHLTDYIENMLRRHNMDGCHSTSLPMDPGFEISQDPPPTSEEERVALSKLPYASIIGELLWICRCCRPDIMFAVAILSRFTSCYSRRHFNALKHVLRYLRGTTSMGLEYAVSEALDLNNCLISYSDSDYAASKDDRKSTSGGIVYLGNCPISWSTRKQGTIATSTTEAEFTAMFETAKDVYFFRNLLETLHIKQSSPTILHCDNSGAFFLSKNPALHNRSKHFEIRYLKLREYVSNKHLLPYLISTKEMVADVFTKALTKPKFDQFRSKIFNLAA